MIEYCLVFQTRQTTKASDAALAQMGCLAGVALGRPLCRGSDWYISSDARFPAGLISSILSKLSVCIAACTVGASPPYRAPWLHTLGVIADADLRHARPCSVIWIGQRNLVLACAIKLV
ncbi:hypothetical protein [Ochrobactrum quorumnocens]|uniref:hypothetical protein n=1 Tax=Ochrobactrum quorumnocens TaxID=271865 RepID=UPI0012FD1090|nr:hypothetical protein [[Ochrobactrum] quorumnocens]